MTLRTLPRLIRTVRHLRASQWVRRIRYTVERRLPPREPSRPPAAGPDEPLADPTRLPRIPRMHGAGLEGRALVDELARGRFTWLNRSVDLDSRRPDWHLGGRTAERLWIVTLHYHEWAYELARVAVSDSPVAAEAAHLLEHYLTDWIDRCDLAVAGARDLAWNGFAIATRLGFWARTIQTLGPAMPRSLQPKLSTSMWRQASYLHDHLEWDLMGNHLLRDLVGLAWAGRLFAGAAPERWLDTAAGIARRQVDEQVLADGAHFERTPMYHVHVMEDVLILALLLRDRYAVERLRLAWLRMAEYLAWMRGPGGRIPLLNDGGWNGAIGADRMLALAGELDLAVDTDPRRGGRLFADAGVVVWQGDPWTVFFDVGPLGPAAVPGHGHADDLTFEAGFDGRRLFVDPGSFGYDRDERRRRDRSTAAHNTVEIDGIDSSEVWHIFRVGRRAATRDVRAAFEADSFQASAAHTGYRHLSGSPMHRRVLGVDAKGRLSIADTLAGSGTHRLRGGLLLDPEWSAEVTGEGWELSHGPDRLRVRLQGPTGLERAIEPAVYHPEYGLELSTSRLSWSCRAALPAVVRTEVFRP